MVVISSLTGSMTIAPDATRGWKRERPERRPGGYVGGPSRICSCRAATTSRMRRDAVRESCLQSRSSFTGDVRDRDRWRRTSRGPMPSSAGALVGDGACALPDISEPQPGVRRVAGGHFDSRIVFLSTCSVCGAQNAVLDETSPTSPLSVYAVTKLERRAAPERQGRDRLGLRTSASAIYSRIRLDLVVNTSPCAHRISN